MASVDNQGVKITYQVMGQGSPILLVHGGFGYKEMWEEMGVVESLKKKYKLISIDLRGHGLSDKPHNPSAYSMKAFTSDMEAVLDRLEIHQVNYWGYSMGGWIGFGMAKYAPDRLTSLICGGAQAHDDWTTGWKSGWLSLFEKGEKAIFKSIKKSIENSMSSDLEDLLNHWLNSITDFDLQAMQALMSYNETLSLETYLETLDIPCLFYGGKIDTGSWVGYEDRFRELKLTELVSAPGVISQLHLIGNPLNILLETSLNQ